MEKKFESCLIGSLLILDLANATGFHHFLALQRQVTPLRFSVFPKSEVLPSYHVGKVSAEETHLIHLYFKAQARTYIFLETLKFLCPIESSAQTFLLLIIWDSNAEFTEPQFCLNIVNSWSDCPMVTSEILGRSLTRTFPALAASLSVPRTPLMIHSASPSATRGPLQAQTLCPQELSEIQTPLGIKVNLLPCSSWDTAILCNCWLHFDLLQQLCQYLYFHKFFYVICSSRLFVSPVPPNCRKAEQQRCV